MMRSLGDQANSARRYIRFGPVCTIHYSESKVTTDSDTMIQLPSYRGFEPCDYWKPIRDEIRQLAIKYGLSELNDNAFKVDIGVCVGSGDLHALCGFIHESNAHQMFRK